MAKTLQIAVRLPLGNGRGSLEDIVVLKTRKLFGLGEFRA